MHSCFWGRHLQPKVSVSGPGYVRYLDKITHVAPPSELRLPLQTPTPPVSPRIHCGATGEEYPDPRAKARPYKVSIESRTTHVASNPARSSPMNQSSWHLYLSVHAECCPFYSRSPSCSRQTGGHTFTLLSLFCPYNLSLSCLPFLSKYDDHV